MGVIMFLSALLLVFLSSAGADPCPSNIFLPFSVYTESMGCVYADPYDKFEAYEPALNRCREVLGSEARLVEVTSLDDQQTILPIMMAAEEFFYPDSGSGRSQDLQPSPTGTWLLCLALRTTTACNSSQ